MLLTAGLLATACAGDETTVDGAPAIVPTSPDTPTNGQRGAATDPPTDTAGTRPGPGKPGVATSAPPPAEATRPGGHETAEPAEPEPPAALTPVDDGGPVGANARAILRDDRPALVVEFDVQEGVEVDPAALDHLRSVLQTVTAKATVSFRRLDEFSSDDTAWTNDDLRAAAAQHRTTATTDQQVSVHVLYVAGGHVSGGEQDEAIGLAYSASTVALFPDRWQGLNTLLESSTAIEQAVLVHEFGHLMALVNLGYDSPIDHEDPEHPGHSSNSGSVMFHAIESTLVGQLFSGSPPSRFDEADRADLEGLRTGRL